LQLAPGLHCFDSTVSVVAPKGRHTRSTPQLPLATPEADPERIIKKGNLSQEGFLLLSQIEKLPGKNDIAESQF
jgi:hypothetical protein